MTVKRRSSLGWSRVGQGCSSVRSIASPLSSLGDGQVDFAQAFPKMAQYDFPGWAVLEWECALKDDETGAADGAAFIAKHIIQVTEKAFDDLAAGGGDRALNRRLMGID